MQIDNNNYIDVFEYIPKHINGKECDNFLSITGITDDISILLYKLLKLHLCDINNWGSLDIKVIAKFQMCNRALKNIDQFSDAKYIKIKLPVLQNIFNGGNYWVKIIDINDEKNINFEYFKFTLIPSINPKKNSRTKSHFLGNNSSNKFIYN